MHLREKKKRYRWYLDEWNPKRPCTLRDSKMQVEGMSASRVIVRTRIGGEYQSCNSDMPVENNVNVKATKKKK